MSQQNKKVSLNRSGLRHRPLAMTTVAATSAAVANLTMAHTVVAHKVKTAGNVAATYHLEPNHNPKAGEPATVWFALTKAGGAQIPLSECDCQLEVQQAGKPIETISLKPIDAEQYQDIPGGAVIFPKVGIYQLVFSGKAKDNASFQPFELKYDVTVQPGKAVNAAPSHAEIPMSKDAVEFASTPSGIPFLIPGLIALAAVVAVGISFWIKGSRN